MQNILFDLDGTLIDHFTTIHKSIAYAQRKLGLPESDYDTVRKTVGGSVALTLGKLCGQTHVEAALPLYQEYFDQIIFEDVFILPGAEWLLEALTREGHKLGVFTNKSIKNSEATLAHLKLDHWFDVIVGTEIPDCPYRKPDPLFTAYVLEKMNCASDEAVMIGDSPYDLGAAEAGCMSCYLVSTGSHSKKELSDYLVADRIFNDLYEVGEQIFNLNSKPTQ